MFKKLRNNLLIVNTLIIATLVIGSFSAIYIITAQNVSRGIDEKLDRSVNFTRNGQDGEGPRDRKIDDKPDRKPDDEIGDNPPPEMREKEQFSLTFTVTTDAEGNVESVNMPFELGDDFYTEKVKEIVTSSDWKGQVKSETGYWAYKLRKTSHGYMAAFTDIQSERAMTRNLFLILLLVGIAALTAAFLISLYSANMSIKPIEASYNKQKQFMADASHELKTPLTTINTNVDVLLSHGESKINDEKKWLIYIKDEAERMTKLTNDLLYLARSDYDEGEKRLFDRVSFSDAAESAILTMEAVMFEKKITLEYDVELDVYVAASPERLKELIIILLDNAVKYTPEGESVFVTLKRSQKKQNAVLTVKNTGSSIAENDLKHIFERFYRSDKSRARSSGGFGLGLAIAKSIAEEAGGSICARSEQGKYTEFTAEIPLAK